MSGKVCIAFAQGCPRSFMDTAVLSSYFEANGWTVTSDPIEAHMILVGTCGFSELCEEVSVNLLSTIVKKNPEATLVAFGCLPGINKEILTEHFQVIPLVRSALNRLDEIIDARIPMSEIMDVNVFDQYAERATSIFTPQERAQAVKNGSKLLRATELAARLSPCPILEYPTDGPTFNIRIAHGCMSECTYCAIRRAVGTVRSKPLTDVMSEFTTGLSDGYKTFRLIAEDVGAYGQDMQISIVDLLQAIFKHKEDFVLSWDDLHPRWLLQYFKELRPLLAENAYRIGHIGIPVQSGSDRILRMMKREYTANQLLDCLSKLRESCPDLRIDTHFLIGFPGETSRDFAETLRLLERIHFYRAMVFVYTDRPKTESADMPGKVSTLTKCRRLWQFRMKIRALTKTKDLELRKVQDTDSFRSKIQ